MYKVTHSILGMAVISAVVGVRQGSPTSCFLFILYVNVLIRNIKFKSGPDSFLQWLHVLMLMDDTVIFASSRERLLEKLRILDEYCITHGMLMNESKTKFMVIHGSADDCMPIKLSDITMYLCPSYIYLGSVFTADGSTISSLRCHVDEKKKHLNKLLIFLRKNHDMPFVVKRKVVEACFNAAILYGAESWINANLRCMEVMYISAIKALLGIRRSIPTEICLAEAGMLPLVSLVKKKQSSFLIKMKAERADIKDDPLMFALELTKHRNKATHDYIEDVMNNYNENKEQESLARKIFDCKPSKTRFRTYAVINPDLSMHQVYDRTYTKDFIPEHYRIAFTRMRTSSHRLKVETGRWTGMDREKRICKCGEAVGDEGHALTECKLTQHLRDNYGKAVTFPDFLINATKISDFKLLYDVLKVSE